MQQPHATISAVDRDLLVRRHLPLVRRVARLHAGRLPAGVELDDLVSWGTLGLLAAVERYDPSRDAGFAAYTRFRIRGAILDQLRQYDWRPRSVREKAAAVGRAARDAERRLGRPASERELATTLGLPLAQYHTLLDEIAPVALVGLDDVAPDLPSDWRGQAEPDEPLAVLLARERTRLVAAAVRRLPEREQLVLSLYYRDELTMKEVGEVLGVTESRVSQLHTQALIRVRASLEQPAAGRRSPESGARLKVGPRTTDGVIGGAWERTGNETPRNGRGGGESPGYGTSSGAGAISSTRTPRHEPSSKRSGVVPARIEAEPRPLRRGDPDPAGP